MRRFLLQFLVLALEGGVSGESPEAAYVIGANVQVSSAQATARHYESYVCADRKHAGHLIAGAFIVRPDNQIDTAFYVSFDHGATWEHTLTVPVAVDPSCAIGSGAAFAASIHDLHDKNDTSVVSVYRSEDGGRTWTPASVDAGAPSLDRVYITVDDTDTSFRGHVYAHAYRYSKSPKTEVLFFPSVNGGRSFEKMLASPAPSFEKPWYFPGNGVVASNGTFFALLAELDDTKKNMSLRAAPDDANAALEIFTSRDGGRTFGLAAKIGGVFYDTRVPQLSLPALAVDRTRGPLRDSLYAVWPDARYEHRTQILFSSSSDHGTTWTAPVVISGDIAGSANATPNNFMPTVAVNKRGIVGVAWYDRRDNPDNLGYHVRFRASVDGGKTWLASVRVSTADHVADTDTRKNNGDTAGLAADGDGVFHPVWIDNRTGIPQMWTTTVEVRPQHPR
jgi:hypothetical protein